MTTGGNVRFDTGDPVQSGAIEFRSLNTKKHYAGKISNDGSFTVASEDNVIGIPPDQYEVVVVQIVSTEDLALQDHSHGSTVPRRYADYYTSDLQCTVNEDEEPIEIIVGVE